MAFSLHIMDHNNCSEELRQPSLVVTRKAPTTLVKYSEELQLGHLSPPNGRQSLPLCYMGMQ
jgi:hypothetical protein